MSSASWLLPSCGAVGSLMATMGVMGSGLDVLFLFYILDRRDWRMNVEGSDGPSHTSALLVLGPYLPL